MNTNKVRTGTVVGVLALSLIAVLAMVMFFAWGQSGPEQAQAASQGLTTATPVAPTATPTGPRPRLQAHAVRLWQGDGTFAVTLSAPTTIETLARKASAALGRTVRVK